MMRNYKNFNLYMMYVIVYLIAIPKIAIYMPPIIQDYVYLFLSLIFMIVIIYWNKEAFQKIVYKILDVCDNSIYIGIITIVLIVMGIVCTYAKSVMNISSSSEYLSIISKYESNRGLYMIHIVLIAPIIEELVYRYVLFKNTAFMNEKPIIKLLICSFLFAGFHVLNEIALFQTTVIIDFLNYFIFGIITTIVYKKTDNILWPISIHMLCNGTALFVINKF